VLIGVAAGAAPKWLKFPAPLRHERQRALAAELIAQLGGVFRGHGAEHLTLYATLLDGLVVHAGGERGALIAERREIPEPVLDERATELPIDVVILQEVLCAVVVRVAAGFDVGVELAMLRVAAALDDRGHSRARDRDVCRVSRGGHFGFRQR